MGGSRAICRAVAGGAAVALLAVTGDVAAGFSLCSAVKNYNVLSLANVNLAASVVEGPLAVGGDAGLKNVSVNSAGKCLAGGQVPNTFAMFAAGDVHATEGGIRGGKLLVGGRLDIHESVDMQCARGIHDKSSVEKLAKALQDSHDDHCKFGSMECRTSVDDESNITFELSTGFGVVCNVSARDLGRAKQVKFFGRGRGQRAIVQVQGGENNTDTLALRGTDLDGFEPEVVLLVLCNVPSLVVDRVRIPAAVFAPKTAVVGVAGHIRGTAVLKSVAGQLDFRSAPYKCRDVLRPSPGPRT